MHLIDIHWLNCYCTYYRIIEEIDKRAGVFIKNVKVKAEMNSKKRKSICFILVILVFLSGMCFDEVKITSYILDATMNEANSYVMSDKITVMEAEVCTTEMLGVRNCVNIRQLARHNMNQKKESRIVFVFLCSNIFAISRGKCPAEFETTGFFKGVQEKNVLNYIHKSDGKKRI